MKKSLLGDVYDKLINALKRKSGDLMANNKIAVVTGASRLKGIGAAICRKLADEGTDIFFTYWSNYDNAMPWKLKENEPEQLKKELLNKGVQAVFMELDLTKNNAAKILFDSVQKDLGEPNILINNAAYPTDNNFNNLTSEELDDHYFVNVRGTILLSVEFARRFNKNKGGRIINLTSGQSLGPMPGELAYATSKGAVEALTVTLSAELASEGITVNAVNPGPTDTGWMTDEIKKDLLPRVFPLTG